MKKVPGTWSAMETLHLIEAYQEKWYALKRGQLRTLQWDEVSAKLESLCQGLPDITPKTSMQCRHKVEKLRRRYRAERQLVLRKGGRRGETGTWPFFEQMDRMERGASAPPLLQQKQHSKNQKRNQNQQQQQQQHQFLPDLSLLRRAPSHPAAPRAQENARNESAPISLDEAEEEAEEEEEEDSDQPPPRVFSTRKRRKHHQQNSYTHKEDYPADSTVKMMIKKKKKPFHGASSSSSLKTEKIQEESPVNPSPPIPPWYQKGHPDVQQASELAYLVHALGENFLRMEQMKIQMQRENELFRADMELRRTEMVIDSQRQIAELFSQAMISMSKKKIKKREEDEEEITATGG